MVTTVARDPQAVHEAMAACFHAAMDADFEPDRWELGFFIHRDLIGIRKPNFQNCPWEPVDSAWGAPIYTVTLEDKITLVCKARVDGKIFNLVAKGY